jgi:short-subunit dehydrogenase
MFPAVTVLLLRFTRPEAAMIPCPRADNAQLVGAGVSDSRVVVLIGGSSGIGRATAHLLAAQGGALVLASRGRAALAETAAECRARGARRVSVHAVDVRERDGVEVLVEEAVAEHGRIDAVINAAGVAAYGDFLDIPAEIFDAVTETNVRGCANVARAALRVFRRQGHGHLVLLGSVLGHIAVPGMTPYVISKHAVAALGRQLTLENRDLAGVHITVVSPGSVDTPIYRQAANYSGRPARPPAPVAHPHTVARAVLGALERPRDRVSSGAVNPLMRMGFALVPRVFDALVGPLVHLVATRPGHIAPTTGNVLGPVEEIEAVRGGQNQGLRDLLARLRGH